jgi:hypothetical protein
MAIAEDEPYVQKILGYGCARGEPSNPHLVLGAGNRRVVWLPLERDLPGEAVRGIIVNLDDWKDVTVMWGGDLASWWPFIQ